MLRPVLKAKDVAEKQPVESGRLRAVQPVWQFERCGGARPGRAPGRLMAAMAEEDRVQNHWRIQLWSYQAEISPGQASGAPRVSFNTPLS